MVRKIYIVGQIDEESYLKFSKRLSALERQNDDPVEIELASEGGFAYAALAFAGRMEASPCELVVKAYGFIASAAVLILAAGDKRILSADSWVMVHEDSGEFEGSVAEIEKKVAHARRMEHQWNKLMEKYSGTHADEWEELHEDTTYLDAVECKTLGLVDEIV